MSDSRRKLIEVALPLEAINRESQHEKDVKVGKPTSVHHWWARRPLSACRAVLFASTVDDPSSRPDRFPTPEDQDKERQRLFQIIQELVRWENSSNESIINAARKEIHDSVGREAPRVLDPFCGGGSIPLEAQRLGLGVAAADLNPVAVLVTKALVDIPRAFVEHPPVNPEARHGFAHSSRWNGLEGLISDLEYYGGWLKERATRQVGHLYPRAQLPDGTTAMVIAWLWARTVKCPNPACGGEMPLIRSFILSSKRGNEAHLHPIVDTDRRQVRFKVQAGEAAAEGTVTSQAARCLICGSVTPLEYVRAEGRQGRLGTTLTSIVADGGRRRIYLDATESQRLVAKVPRPMDVLDTELPTRALGFRVQAYGMTSHASLFTARQLLGLRTFSDLVTSARRQVIADGGHASYANAIATYLAFAVDRIADWGNTLSRWENKAQVPQQVFGLQTLSMTWDYAESNFFSSSTGSFDASIKNVCRSLRALPSHFMSTEEARVEQFDAASVDWPPSSYLVVTDPPYYDNIGYADLSDFFFVWLRRSLKDAYPDLFSTLLTPKDQELVADPYRFEGNRLQAETHFEIRFRHAFERLRTSQRNDIPLVVYYAFKQQEQSASDGAHAGLVSTGWERMLEGLIQAGLAVRGTWPMRTEMSSRRRGQASNALASSIAIVCRAQTDTAPLATRREFALALRRELPRAMEILQHANIAPVDLAQAAIGPGMEIFTRYLKVIEADGSTMTVRAALTLINQALDEILAEQEGDFDSDTRFAVTWFDQHGTSKGPYGEADVLARAKNTSVAGMEEAGVLHSRAGKVRLLNREELSDSWDPAADRRITVWEVTQHLIKRLEGRGEEAAADLLRRVGGLGETARELAYRLYTTCERKGWSQDALSYNALVVAWPEIARRVAGTPEAEAQQALEV